MTLVLTPEDLNRARLACGAAATHLRAKRTQEAKDEARRYDSLAARFSTEREHALARLEAEKDDPCAWTDELSDDELRGGALHGTECEDKDPYK